MSQRYPKDNKFICMIDDGTIYQISPEGKKIEVGKTTLAYEELNEVTQEYYEKLIELGAIEPELTQAEINAQQKEFMSEILSTMKILTQKVEGLENERTRACKDSEKDVPEESKAD